MSFGANAIGFFLDIDASRMRSELSSAKKEYSSFVDQIEKLNKKAVGAIEKGIADIAAATRKQSRTALGGGSGGRMGVDAGLVRELTRVLTTALSHAQIRLQPSRPLRKNPIFDQSQSIVQSFRRMPQPPDFIGGFKLQRFAEAERRGPVRAHPGMRAAGMSSRIGDHVLIRANEGEVITKQETYEDLVVELQKKRGNDERNNERIRKLLERNADVVEALSRVRQAQSLGNVAAQYGKYGIGVRNAGEILGSLRSGREGLQAALAGMSQEDFRAMTEVIGDMDEHYASMENHLERMAKSSSTVRKNTEATTKSSRRSPIESNVRYLAFSQAMRDVRGMGAGAQTVFGGTPVTQEQFARSYARLGMNMQSGREAFTGAYGITGSLVGADTLSGSLYAASQSGFRGRALSRIGAAAAMAQQGGGLDPTVMVDLAASMRRFGYSTGAQQSVIAGVLGNQQAVGANGALLSSILSGSDLAGMIATRGPRNAANVATGMSSLAAGLLSAGGNDERAAGSATALMQAITGYGKGDVSQLARLAGGFQLDQGTLDQFLKTGDVRTLQSSAGFARSMLEQNPMVRSAYAEMAGMDVGSYTDALRALADLPVQKLKSTIESASQAMDKLARASGNAANFADRFGNTFDRIGASVGSASGGLWNAAVETPWERVYAATQLGGMAGDMLGRYAPQSLKNFGRGARVAGRRAMRSLGLPRAVSGFGGMARAAPAAAMAAGGLGMASRSSYARTIARGASRAPGMLGRVGGMASRVGGVGAKIGGAILGGGLALEGAAMAGGGLGMGLAGLGASASIGPLAVLLAGVGQFYAGKQRATELNYEFVDKRIGWMKDLESQIAAAKDPTERARLEKVWGENRSYLANNQRTAAIDTWESAKGSFGFSDDRIAEIESAAAQFGSNRGIASQLIGMAMADKNVRSVSDLTPLLGDLKNIRASTVQGAITELGESSQRLIESGSAAINTSEATSDDEGTRDKAQNKILMQIRDTLVSIAGMQRGMGAPSFAGIGQE